ncbi:hypothetical protein C0075_03430 [Rhizobium sp. KAs_5_22]|nr:hypothetical protein C0075_03430 [Rhizobium sp. KAs_5_22]
MLHKAAARHGRKGRIGLLRDDNLAGSGCDRIGLFPVAIDQHSGPPHDLTSDGQHGEEGGDVAQQGAGAKSAAAEK